VALGVLRGLDVAGHSSGREKARSAAAALTEQDQERLRSFRAVDLANYDEERTVYVNGVKYTVNSQVDWVRDSTGGTQSCNNSATQADYMRITSTTTSNLVNTPIAPIKLASIVAPPVGAFGTNQGTLGIQVNDRNGVGVPDLDVTIAGPTTITNPTNSAGCAIFAYVPVGSYTASLNTAGWVDKGGNQNASTGATVSNGTVNVKNMFYDQAASVDAKFDTETRDGATVSAQTTQLSASNGGVPSGPFAPFAGERVWDPAGGSASTISATGLFPFVDGYGLYGGGCPGADPSANDSDFYTSYPSMVTDVTPGAASPAVTVRLPSINLRILYSLAPMAETYRATTKVVVYSKGTNCSEIFTYNAPATEAPVSPATVGSGYLANSALPFGNYTVCAQSRTPGSPSTTRFEMLTGVKNWFYKGMKPPDIASPVIDMLSGTSSGSCPATA
jgi:hypothetical protein